VKRLTVALLVFSAFTPVVFGQTVEPKEPTVFPDRIEIIRGTKRDYQNVITAVSHEVKSWRLISCAINFTREKWR
jgi:hypothetical protein